VGTIPHADNDFGIGHTLDIAVPLCHMLRENLLSVILLTIRKDDGYWPATSSSAGNETNGFEVQVWEEENIG
jgi:hypothetical protein